MRLYLMQHAPALSEAIDPEQPLSAMGAEQAETAGRAMAVLGVKPASIHASPKRRALQTAHAVAQGCGLASEVIESHALKAGTAPTVTLEYLRSVPREEALFVGHLPNLERFTALLIGEGLEGRAHVTFVNAGLTCLDVTDLTHPRASLLYHLTHAHLRRLAV